MTLCTRDSLVFVTQFIIAFAVTTPHSSEMQCDLLFFSSVTSPKKLYHERWRRRRRRRNASNNYNHIIIMQKTKRNRQTSKEKHLTFKCYYYQIIFICIAWKKKNGFSSSVCFVCSKPNHRQQSIKENSKHCRSSQFNLSSNDKQIRKIIRYSRVQVDISIVSYVINYYYHYYYFLRLFEKWL